MLNPQEELTLLGSWIYDHGWRISLILFTAILSALLLRNVIKVLVKRVQMIDEVENSEFDKRTKTMFWMVRNAGMVLIIITSILMILKELDIDVGPALTSAGIVGLALGFGTQTLVKDAINGIFILIESQYQIGDTIQVNGITGVVEKLSLRSSHVRDFEGNLHFIPNGDIRTVTNKTRGWGRVILDINIGSNDDIDLGLATLLDVGMFVYSDERYRDHFLEEPSVTGVESLDDWTNRIRLIAKVNAGSQATLLRELRRKAAYMLPQKGLTLPYPQQEVIVHTPESA